jgi:hypothetical protein
MSHAMCVVVNRIHYHAGDFGLPQMARAAAGVVQPAVQIRKSFLVRRSRRASAIVRKATLQSPGEKDWIGTDSAHNVELNGLADFLKEN